jgi:hypothetical protein
MRTVLFGARSSRGKRESAKASTSSTLPLRTALFTDSAMMSRKVEAPASAVKSISVMETKVVSDPVAKSR